MKPLAQTIRQEMRHLITKSCQSLATDPSRYKGLHKSLLKFYYRASDVSIDLDKKFITLWKSAKQNLDQGNVLQFPSDIPQYIEFQSLEETLMECLESGDIPTRFYKSLLFQYNRVAAPIPSQSISA